MAVVEAKYLCRVCGISNYPDLPWGEIGLEPSNNICRCCGIEFGYEDDGDALHLAEIREHWVKVKNCKWFARNSKPKDWDMASQIRGIASEFRGPDDEALIEYYLERQRQ